MKLIGSISGSKASGCLLEFAAIKHRPAVPRTEVYQRQCILQFYSVGGIRNECECKLKKMVSTAAQSARTDPLQRAVGPARNITMRTYDGLDTEGARKVDVQEISKLFSIVSRR